MQVSIWEAESFYGHKQVIIIGAGLAGLWSAIELHKKNSRLSILILEKGMIPSGASTRNAGFACFGSPTELWHDIETVGLDATLQTVEMRYKGIKKIRSYFGEVIDYDNCGGYELLSDDFDDNNLSGRLTELNKSLQGITGEEATFGINDEKINQFNFNGFKYLIENKLEGGLHSGKLVQALTKKALALGIEIITQAEITSWQQGDDGIKVSTKQGVKFSCDKLLLCTNGFTGSLTQDIDIKPGRGQIVVTSPVENLPFRGTFHFDGGFYYFRNIGNRVLLGGARNKAFEEETTNALETTGIIQNELQRFLQEHILPGRTFAIEHRWSGIMGFTGNHQPIVKEIEPCVFAVITCNGMGVALSPIIAEKVAELVTA